MRLIEHDQALPEGTLTLANDADVLADAARLAGAPALALQFPKWTDGRAYSQAVLLRARLRFAGEVVAIGDVVADMAPLLRRCGFSAARLRAGQRFETALQALGAFDGVGPYQTDPGRPVAHRLPFGPNDDEGAGGWGQRRERTTEAAR